MTKPCVPDGQADVCDTSDFQPIPVHLSRDESGDETQTLTRLIWSDFSMHIII